MYKKLILLLLFFSFFLLPTAVFAQSSSWTTKVGNPSGPPPGEISIPPPPPPDQIKQTLYDLFGINLVGTYNYEGAKNIYQTIALVAKSSTYMTNLNSRKVPVTIHLGEQSSFGNCTGFKSGPNDIHLYNPLGSGGCGDAGVKYVMIHELGHIIDSRTSLRTRFVEDAVGKDGYLKTYPFKNSDSESFAEMIADYVVYKVYTFSMLGRKTFPQYPSEYPNYYRFARDIIFGGIEF